MKRERRGAIIFIKYQEDQASCKDWSVCEPLRQAEGGSVVAPNYPELIDLSLKIIFHQFSVDFIEDESR